MRAASVDLKKTVNLPRTDFPMKANLAQMEPKILARWDDEGLYGKIRAARAGRPMYVLHDGPPYANGNIHLGHALNKILKDFIVKLKTMEGYDSPYVPGWDCHGLPIESKVDNQLGSRKSKMTTAQIREECRKYAAKYVDLQRKDFIRLGVLGPLGQSLSDDDRAVRVGDRGRVRRVSGPRLCLQGTEVGQLVHSRPHRAGRGRNRVRESHQPVHLGSLSAHLRSGADRSGAGGPPGERRHLDHHALDDSSQRRHRLSSEIRIRGRGRGGRGLYRRARAAQGHGGKTRLERPQGDRELSRVRSWKARSSGIRFWNATPSGFSASTSRWSKAPARSTPLPAMVRRTSRSASSTGCRSIVRSTRLGASSTPKVRRAGFRKRSSAKRSGTLTRSSTKY